MATQAILLPGSVLPAALAYPALVDALGSEVHAIAKELEVYAGDEPPAGYSLDTEVDGVLRAADEAGWDRFHLVGYSGGGAACLACAVRHADRLLSLGLLEPAWAGRQGMTHEEDALWREFDQMAALPAEEMMPRFVRAQLKPGVDLPPPPADPSPAWMSKRPAGIRALIGTFRKYELDTERLTSFGQPVYYALGGLSNPDWFGKQSQRLGRLFPAFTLEIYEERHHFDPPHRVEPERVARALKRLWEGAARA